MSLLFELASALERGDLIVDYEPIVALGEGRTVAVEVRLRRPDSEGTWVEPADLASLAADDAGAIASLGAFMLGEAACQLAGWRRAHTSALPMGVLVNVPTAHLARPDFVATLVAIRDHHGLRPADVCICVRMPDTGDLARAYAGRARRRRHTGLHGLGRGYASLSVLSRLPFTLLTFRVDDLDLAERTTGVLAAAVMSLGASLRMTTIALRVASAAEAEHLRNLGCEAAQGSLLGPPQSAAAIDAML